MRTRSRQDVKVSSAPAEARLPQSVRAIRTCFPLIPSGHRVNHFRAPATGTMRTILILTPGAARECCCVRRCRGRTPAYDSATIWETELGHGNGGGRVALAGDKRAGGCGELVSFHGQVGLSYILADDLVFF